MRIGIDFDNTIACYDGVFHAAALDRGLISSDVPRDKNSVRNVLNSTGRKDEFTALQGYVYGARMDLVQPYRGAVDFIHGACRAGHEVFIVSHKTRYPLLGERYDLHAAARGFLEAQAIIGPTGLIPDRHAFFELTKEEKLARATALNVQIFVDDLPEILMLPGWSDTVRRILFDPDGHFPARSGQEGAFERYTNWAEIHRIVLPR